MFSAHDSDEVLGELGSKFLEGLARATDAAREDLRDLRAWHPDWVAQMFQREVAGFVHSRIWAHLTLLLDGVDGFAFTTREPHREASISGPTGRTFVVRVKRHNEGDRISSYPTATDIEFWGGGQMPFEGWEAVSLAAGYRWASDTGEVGPAVISYREGKNNVIWAVEIDGGAADGSVPLTYTPILPDLPQIDLAAGIRNAGRGTS